MKRITSRWRQLAIVPIMAHGSATEKPMDQQPRTCAGDVHVFEFGATRCQCGAKASTQYPAPPGDDRPDPEHTTDGSRTPPGFDPRNN